MVKHLIDNGAQIDTKDENGLNAIELAKMQGSMMSVLEFHSVADKIQ